MWPLTQIIFLLLILENFTRLCLMNRLIFLQYLLTTSTLRSIDLATNMDLRIKFIVIGKYQLFHALNTAWKATGSIFPYHSNLITQPYPFIYLILFSFNKPWPVRLENRWENKMTGRSVICNVLILGICSGWMTAGDSLRLKLGRL